MSGKRSAPFPRFSMAKRVREPVTATSLYDPSPDSLPTDTSDACNSNKYTWRYSGTSSSCFSGGKNVYSSHAQQPPGSVYPVAPAAGDFSFQPQGGSGPYPPAQTRAATPSQQPYQQSRQQAPYPVQGQPQYSYTPGPIHSSAPPGASSRVQASGALGGPHESGYSGPPGGFTRHHTSTGFGSGPPSNPPGGGRTPLGVVNRRGGEGFGEHKSTIDPAPHHPPAAAAKWGGGATQQQGKPPIKKPYSSTKEDTLRIVTATAKGVQFWADQMKAVNLLFEVFGVLQTSPGGGEANCKAFSLAVSDGVLQCRYYEMDYPFPAGSAVGDLLRCVGSWDNSQAQLRCVSVRTSSHKEQLLAKKLVALSDAEMRERVNCDREQ